ncbi:MAG: pyrrolo-quinoline quinone [Bacteroidetes bacterium GWF2_41_9]|nr:MAG: pyrrolo-quinoline quinone [Bacteroidetes bacterium GWF2_41_9]
MQKHLCPVFSTPLSLFLLISLIAGCSSHDEKELTGAGKDWPVYLGDKSGSHYSNLKEITRTNVDQLVPAWQYATDDSVSGNRTQIQCNPIIIDGILYGTSPSLKVFALDAASGRQIWEFDPEPEDNYAKNVNRGVTYWQNEQEKRILFTSGPDMYALNAETGEPVERFGRSGRISLHEGLGDRAEDLYLAATSPGIVYHDLIIIGSRVSEEAGAAPGYIRAFNILTGELMWTFKTIPGPGEFGYETWPTDAWKSAGGANSWAGMSLDESRGIVFVPTGSASFDFWGGNRIGANLFANCILALNAQTGERIWHFQTVHHDVWDRDLPAPPNLLTVIHNGKKIDAVAQITKSGFVFLLDRETGKPLFPVEEISVPGSDLKDEETWPSQPIPKAPPPFVPQIFTENEITNISPESYNFVAGFLASVRTGELFMPPSTQGTIIFPGFDGGGEWGGAAVDPEKGVLYINGNIMPWILQMVELTGDNSAKKGEGESIYEINCAVCHGIDRQGDPTGTYPALRNTPEKFTRTEILKLINTGKGFMPSFKHIPEKKKEALVAFLYEQDTKRVTVSGQSDIGLPAVPYTHTGYNRFFDQHGYPAVKPPWGTISAIDLNKGKILWQVPLGEYPELTAMGIPQTGTENYGGPVVTAGGLIFIGASKDEYFRAFDKYTGKELWKYKLPAGGYATPSVYEAGGKQYIVIACGGGKMGTKSDDKYLAFALPALKK